MNASEFQSARGERLKAFDRDYIALKQNYDVALNTAINEQDRPTQCQRIKEVLDVNKKMSQLVQEVLVGSEEGTCKLSVDRVRQLRNDIEMYKQQYADIQQGKDRVYALRQALSKEEERVNIVKGAQALYLGLLALILIVLVVLVIRASLTGVFNTQSVSQVSARGFA